MVFRVLLRLAPFDEKYATFSVQTMGLKACTTRLAPASTSFSIPSTSILMSRTSST